MDIELTSSSSVNNRVCLSHRRRQAIATPSATRSATLEARAATSAGGKGDDIGSDGGRDGGDGGGGDGGGGMAPRFADMRARALGDAQHFPKSALKPKFGLSRLTAYVKFFQDF